MSRAHDPLLISGFLSLFIQEELHHFETKVEKHSHYQEQLELSHQKLQHVEALGDQKHIQKTQEKYNTLAEKTREIGYKVRGRANLLSGGSPSNLVKWIGNKTMLKVVRKCSYKDQVEQKLGGRVDSSSRSMVIIIITPEAEEIYVPEFK